MTGVLATAGTFTHVTGVYDGTRIALFVNGVLATEVPTSMDIIPVNDLALRIGGDAGGGSLFPGIIDEPRIVARGLSNAEVQSCSINTRSAVAEDVRRLDTGGPDLRTKARPRQKPRVRWAASSSP